MTDVTPDQAEMTIDQIAQFAAVPSSTVRMYQNKGLLPPPVKRGRVGYYTEEHRERLRIIAHLQGRGFSLAAIKESIDSWNAGQSIAQLLGVGKAAPPVDRPAIRLSLNELTERFGGIAVEQADIQRAARIGVIEIDGTDVLTKEAFADAGPRLSQVGMTLTEILDEYEALQTAVGEIAERFRTVFERHIWADFEAAGLPAQDVTMVTSDVETLAEIATTVVTVELQSRFTEFAEDYLSRGTPAS